MDSGQFGRLYRRSRGEELLELQDDIRGEGDAGALGATGKRRGVVQRGIVANLRPHDDAFEIRHILRQHRGNGHAAGEFRIGRRRRSRERGVEVAVLGVHEIEVVRIGRDEEIIVVTEDFSAAAELDPIVELIGRIAGKAIGVDTAIAVVMRVIRFADEGQLVGRLPGDRDVVQIAPGRVRIAAAEAGDERRIGVVRADVGRRDDRNLAVEEVQAEATFEARRIVVVAGIAIGRAIPAKAGVHAGDRTRIDVEHRGDMRHRHHAGILERDAEVEDVAVRIEDVVGRVDDFRAEQRDELTDFDVEAAAEDIGEVGGHPGFFDVELIDVADAIVAFAEVVRVARVGAVEQLDLEAVIDALRARIDRALQDDRRLIEERRIRLVVEQAAEVDAAGAKIRIAGDAGFENAADGERAPPGGRRCRRCLCRWQIRSHGWVRTEQCGRHADQRGGNYT